MDRLLSLRISILALLIFPLAVSAQQKKTATVNSKWNFDAGITIAKSFRAFKQTNTIGFGIDLYASTPSKSNNKFSYGGRFNYAFFLAKKNTNPGSQGNYPVVHLAGILANGQYSFSEKIIAGLDLGLGLAYIKQTHIGVAGSLYVGYQFKSGSRSSTIALYVEQNRSVNASWNYGLRYSIRI